MENFGVIMGNLSEAFDAGFAEAEIYGLEGIGIEKKEPVDLTRISTWAIYLQRSEPGG
jgi:hypothetical protein